MTRQIEKNSKRHFHCSLTFHRVSGGAAQFISFWRKQITPQEHTQKLLQESLRNFFPVKPQWSFGNRWEEENVRLVEQLSGGAYLAPAVVSRREINHQIIFACLLHQDF